MKFYKNPFMYCTLCKNEKIFKCPLINFIFFWKSQHFVPLTINNFRRCLVERDEYGSLSVFMRESNKVAYPFLLGAEFRILRYSVDGKNRLICAISSVVCFGEQLLAPNDSSSGSQRVYLLICYLQWKTLQSCITVKTAKGKKIKVVVAPYWHIISQCINEFITPNHLPSCF